MAKLNTRKTVVTVAAVSGLVLLGWICSTWIVRAPDPSFARPGKGESVLMLASGQWRRMDTPDGTDIVVCDGEFRDYGKHNGWRCRKYLPRIARLLFLPRFDDARFFQLKDWIERKASSKSVSHAPDVGPHQELAVYLRATGDHDRDTGLDPQQLFSGVGALSDGKVVSQEEVKSWQAGVQAKESTWQYRFFGVETTPNALFLLIFVLVFQWWLLGPFVMAFLEWLLRKKEI